MHLFLVLSFLASTHNDAWIVLCAVGLGAVAIFYLYRLGLYVLGRHRGTVNANGVPPNELKLEPAADPVVTSGEERKEERQPEIIRISPQPIATSSVEMSQQQRIAAALAKAGLANSWEPAKASTQNDVPEPSDRTPPPKQ